MQYLVLGLSLLPFVLPNQIVFLAVQKSCSHYRISDSEHGHTQHEKNEKHHREPYLLQDFVVLDEPCEEYHVESNNVYHEILEQLHAISASVKRLAEAQVKLENQTSI